jgi:hypothetical protein
LEGGADPLEGSAVLGVVWLGAGPLGDFPGGAVRPIPVEQGPPVQVVEGQGAQVDLVLLGVDSIEVLVG